MGRGRLRSVSERRCQNCGHKWLPRVMLKPRLCPKCGASRWDRARPKVKATAGKANAP